MLQGYNGCYFLVMLLSFWNKTLAFLSNSKREEQNNVRSLTQNGGEKVEKHKREVSIDISSETHGQLSLFLYLFVHGGQNHYSESATTVECVYVTKEYSVCSQDGDMSSRELTSFPCFFLFLLSLLLRLSSSRQQVRWSNNSPCGDSSHTHNSVSLSHFEAASLWTVKTANLFLYLIN
jgi:hypothetical protein